MGKHRFLQVDRCVIHPIIEWKSILLADLLRGAFLNPFSRVDHFALILNHKRALVLICAYEAELMIADKSSVLDGGLVVLFLPTVKDWYASLIQLLLVMLETLLHLHG